MKVTFGPKTDKGVTCSFISWDNKHLHNALRQLFDEKEYEVVTEIAVTPEGIKAFIHHRRKSEDVEYFL